MGGLSLVHWIIVGAVLLLLFGGKNKISDVMGDVAKGIKSFKKGLSEDDQEPSPPARPAEPVRTLDHQPVSPPRSSPPLSQPVAQDEAGPETRRAG